MPSTHKFGQENISDVHFVFPRHPKSPGGNTNPRSVKSLGIITKALPPNALRWEWTVETVAADLTAYRAIKMSD